MVQWKDPLILSAMSNPERINIKDLTLEEPEKKEGLPFDVERDITEEDWKKLIDTLSGYRVGGEWYEFGWQAMAMKIIFPDKFSDVALDETVWHEMKKRLDGWRIESRWNIEGLIWHTCQMKILFPERVGELNLNEGLWEGIKIAITRDRLGHLWRALADKLIAAKILFPEMISELHFDEFDEEVWREIKKEMDSSRAAGNWEVFSWRAVALKFFFPKRVQELGLDAKAWQGMEDMLPQYQADDAQRDFAVHAMLMKLLAAEEINITDKGLEIIMQKKDPEFKEETPPMPQARKF